MAFPWELNLDRPYHDEKWPFPERRARGESTRLEYSAAPLEKPRYIFRQTVRIGKAPPKALIRRRHRQAQAAAARR